MLGATENAGVPKQSIASKRESHEQQDEMAEARQRRLIVLVALASLSGSDRSY
jgi:hypothetical protein